MEGFHSMKYHGVIKSNIKGAFTVLPTMVAVSFGLSVLPYPLLSVVDAANGATAFTQQPRLVSASTPYTDTSILDATYYFTVELPATSGEPLQKVTFSQAEGSQLIRFDQQDSVAFEGTRSHHGPKLVLKPAKSDRSSKTVTVAFDPPLQPGKTVTIGIRPVRNPLYDGVYLFGVTAFPPGEQAAGQFLGFGRLQFYTDGNN